MNSQYVDLIISERKPKLNSRLRGDYRICTLSRNRGQRYINLRVPESVQDKIIAAYEQGKTVRIFG